LIIDLCISKIGLYSDMHKLDNLFGWNKRPIYCIKKDVY